MYKLSKKSYSEESCRCKIWIFWFSYDIYQTDQKWVSRNASRETLSSKAVRMRLVVIVLITVRAHPVWICCVQQALTQNNRFFYLLLIQRLRQPDSFCTDFWEFPFQKIFTKMSLRTEKNAWKAFQSFNDKFSGCRSFVSRSFGHINGDAKSPHRIC